MLFGCPRWNITHSSEKLKVICIKRFVFYAIINHQFWTSELKKLCRETGGELGMYTFVQSVQ